MTKTFIAGFADELIKLAVGDVEPEPEDPNLPWRADTQARGIKQTATRPSIVQSGQLGDTGPAGKDTEPKPRERGDIADVQTGTD